MKMMTPYFRRSGIFLAGLLFLPAACQNNNTTIVDHSVIPTEAYAGGDLTTFDLTGNIFDLPAPNLSLERRVEFLDGNAFFNFTWTTPGSAAVSGLGPVFNNKSCVGCHIKDGRGRPPGPGKLMSSMLTRISIPGEDPVTGGPLGVPGFGDQLNNRGLVSDGTNPAVPPEGHTEIEYTEIQGQFANGTVYTLLKPEYTIIWNAAFDDPGEVLVSPRVANQMVGLGLLQSVPARVIEAAADPDDADEDGISGRPNYVWDARTETTVLGRFGWKANQPNLFQQNLGAALGDIGLTSPLFPEENCADGQSVCAAWPSGDNGHSSGTELNEVVADRLSVYTHLLAVPGRRDWADPDVLAGKKIFFEIGCETCHTSRLTTGENPDFPELSHQIIFPYTDLLLHDMGEDLADNRPDFKANGREWRTAPLWGIGLIERVNGHTRFLHDGRARSLEEAVLWHGGEAAGPRDKYKALSVEKRKQLIRFLESL